MQIKTIPISIRLEEDILLWFKAHKGYQGAIKKVLRDYVESEKAEKNKRLGIKLGRAQEVFRQMYTRCFWHYDPDLEVNEGNFYLIIDRLKKYGGKEGYLLAEELCR